jgi:hypothetical protein
MISILSSCYCEDSDTGSGHLFLYGFMQLQAYVWILLSVCRTSRDDVLHVLFGTVIDI